MKKIRAFFKLFTPFEYVLLTGSALAIVLSFVLCGNRNYFNLAASLIGACSLILIAKGIAAGQILVIVFAAFYGAISYFNRYYGEMITYLGMTVPTAIVALVSWLRHPYRDTAQVEVNRLPAWEYPVWIAASAAVSVAFFFLLRALGNANLIWSTVSVFTSFVAACLAARRSPFYAVGYALNDAVLIVLWTLAALTDRENAAMVVCFCVFLINDGYGFLNWIKMKRMQSSAKPDEEKADRDSDTIKG